MELLRREVGTLRAERDAAVAALVTFKVASSDLLLEERARRVAAERERDALRAGREKA